ncbi:MAG: hypothetical protein IJL92_00245, partial [Thermoguttaceae bacterium]|nr:hypothetical protein [Thermoguttaceae bacterium]
MQFDSIRNLFVNAVERSARKSNGRGRHESNTPPHARALLLESLESRDLLSATPFEAASVSEIALASLETTPLDALDLTALQSASEPASTVVTSLADSVDATDGVVTLREAITVYANAGDTITFAPTLKGGTITLGGSEIEINKSLTIDASALRNGTDGTPGVTIDADSKSRIFYVRQGSLEINSLAFTGGFKGGSDAYGGAIYAAGSTNLTISNSSFYDNTARASSAYGGAIFFFGASLTISNSRFHNNTANATSYYYSYGGAIYYNSSATLTISNSTFTKNTATYSSSSGTTCGGSAIYFNNGSANLYNVTIYGNTTRGTGALYLNNASSTLNVYNSIVCNNSGGDFYKYYSYSSINAYNVLSSWTGGLNGLASVYAYDSSNPLFANAAEDDYSLAPGSQAINRGNNEYVAEDAATDLAGAQRIIAGTVDLGAYEYATNATPETPSTVVTSLADTLDATDGVVTLREAITFYANEGDTITFAPALKGGTITLAGTQIEIRKSITIDASALRNGTDGTPGVTLDANSQSRFFYVRQGSVEINSLAFTGGSDAYGGAIYAASSTNLTITNSSFYDNTTSGISAYGGAIYAASSTNLTITNSSFYDNTASASSSYAYGGAI